MATFKLGAIVTDIVGSIGGTTFKRGANSLVMMNKNFGPSKNKLYKNKQLNVLGNIFREYTYLSDEDKATWVTAASEFQFPDKFGDLKYLTPRQLYIKTNGQLINADIQITDATGMTSYIAPATVTAVTFNTSNNHYYIYIDANSTISNWYVTVEVSPNILPAPTYISRPVLFYEYNNGDFTIDIYAPLLAAYPYINSNYYVRVYLQQFNDFGFQNAPVAFDAVWI